MRNKKILAIGLSLFLSYLIFTILVKFSLFSGIDLQTTEISQKIIPRALSFPFSLLSLLGSLEIASLILLLLLYIFKVKNYIFTLIFFIIFHAIELFGKLFVNHPGPPPSFFRYDISFVFPSSSVQTGFSYPSGHIARTMFISVIILLLFSKAGEISKVNKKIIYSAVLIFDILMFISRIYLGEHWLSDAIGGSILGLSLGILSLYSNKRRS